MQTVFRVVKAETSFHSELEETTAASAQHKGHRVARPRSGDTDLHIQFFKNLQRVYHLIGTILNVYNKAPLCFSSLRPAIQQPPSLPPSTVSHSNTAMDTSWKSVSPQSCDASENVLRIFRHRVSTNKCACLYLGWGAFRIQHQGWHTVAWSFEVGVHFTLGTQEDSSLYSKPKRCFLPFAKATLIPLPTLFLTPLIKLKGKVKTMSESDTTHMSQKSSHAEKPQKALIYTDTQ